MVGRRADRGFQRNRKEGTMHRMMLGVVAFAWMGVVSGPGVAAAKEKPAATLKLSGKSVAAGGGISWGKRKLKYKGEQHPFSIEGPSVGDVGGARNQATRERFPLKEVRGLQGEETPGSPGAGGGRGR